MNDLTIIFLTVNKVPENWRLFHRQKLLEAVGEYPIITVSRVLMTDMPGTNIIQEERISAANVYVQMLKAMRLATTPYVAIAEDDSLYPYEHFHTFRPSLTEFAYNMSRWSLYEWREPVYCWRDRISNLTMIAPRELAIKCLEERFEKYDEKYKNGISDFAVGELGKPRIQNLLRLPQYKIKMFHTEIAIININHQYSMDDRELRRVKRPGPLRAYDIPYWGHAKDILEKFK